jgi:hypothetical protein
MYLKSELWPSLSCGLRFSDRGFKGFIDLFEVALKTDLWFTGNA